LNLGIEVYTSQGTAGDLKHHNLKIVESEKQFTVGEFKVLPFATEHDAPLPLGFLIQSNFTKEKILFLTDSYYCKYHFNFVNYIMVESNYTIETLNRNVEEGYIDQAMKNRLLESHMSLENCKKFLKATDLSKCSQIVLLHLSDSNSDSRRMVKEIYEQTGIETIVADAGLEIDLEMHPY